MVRTVHLKAALRMGRVGFADLLLPVPDALDPEPTVDALLGVLGINIDSLTTSIWTWKDIKTQDARARRGTEVRTE